MEFEPTEAALVAVEASAFARAVPDDAARTRLESLAGAARSGSVPDELVPALETMLELLFTRGRPANRAALQAVYGRTPRGKQQREAAHEVNRALKTLEGQQLAEVRITAAPGSHALLLETDRVRLTLEFDASGARVVSLETG